MYADAIPYHFLFHFGVHIITPTSFVGVSSAKIIFKMHCTAKAASSCSNTRRRPRFVVLYLELYCVLFLNVSMSVRYDGAARGAM